MLCLVAAAAISRVLMVDGAGKALAQGPLAAGGHLGSSSSSGGRVRYSSSSSRGSRVLHQAHLGQAMM